MCLMFLCFFFFFSSRRRHTRWPRDWSSECALPIFCCSDGSHIIYYVTYRVYSFLYISQKGWSRSVKLVLSPFSLSLSTVSFGEGCISIIIYSVSWFQPTNALNYCPATSLLTKKIQANTTNTI